MIYRQGSNLPGRPPALSKWKVRKPSPPSRSKLRLRPMISTWCRFWNERTFWAIWPMVQGIWWVVGTAICCSRMKGTFRNLDPFKCWSDLDKSLELRIHSLKCRSKKKSKIWSLKAGQHGQHQLAHLLASCKRFQSPRFEKNLTIIQRSFSKGKLLRNERNHTLICRTPHKNMANYSSIFPNATKPRLHHRSHRYHRICPKPSAATLCHKSSAQPRQPSRSPSLERSKCFHWVKNCISSALSSYPQYTRVPTGEDLGEFLVNGLFNHIPR